jgi:hypothetical protein
VLRYRGVAATALAVLCALAPPALAHEGNPNYRSEVRAISPPLEGLDAQILNFDDRIQLRNDSGETVVVEGYRGEPYLRFEPDGMVLVNQRSPTTYLNEDRFADVEVPETADPRAAPEWQMVARNGRYHWHDHRIHWMSKTPPERVREDESARVKVFDWKLPLTANGRAATISGSLTWVGEEGDSFPVAAVLSLALAILAGIVLVVVVRRRRKPPAADREHVEAW